MRITSIQTGSIITFIKIHHTNGHKVQKRLSSDWQPYFFTKIRSLEEGIFVHYFTMNLVDGVQS